MEDIEMRYVLLFRCHYITNRYLYYCWNNYLWHFERKFISNVFESWAIHMYFICRDFCMFIEKKLTRELLYLLKLVKRNIFYLLNIYLLLKDLLKHIFMKLCQNESCKENAFESNWGKKQGIFQNCIKNTMLFLH